MPDTAIIIGSTPVDDGFDVDGNGSEYFDGNFYLRHPTSSLSLLARAQTIIGNSVAGASVTMRENLRVRFSASAPFQVEWDSVAIAELFGFSGAFSLTGAASYDAPNASPLLWAPGYPATPTTIQGKAGYVVPHTTFHSSDDETTIQTQHFGSGVWQELDWSLVPTSRMQVPDGDPDGNTMQGLYRTCLQYGYRFRYHQSVIENVGTDAIVWNDSEAFGPYQLRGGLSPSWYKRLVENADDYGAKIGLEMKQVEEYA